MRPFYCLTEFLRANFRFRRHVEFWRHLWSDFLSPFTKTFIFNALPIFAIKLLLSRKMSGLPQQTRLIRPHYLVEQEYKIVKSFACGNEFHIITNYIKVLFSAVT